VSKVNSGKSVNEKGDDIGDKGDEEETDIDFRTACAYSNALIKFALRNNMPSL